MFSFAAEALFHANTLLSSIHRIAIIIKTLARRQAFAGLVSNYNFNGNLRICYEIYKICEIIAYRYIALILSNLSSLTNLSIREKIYSLEKTPLTSANTCMWILVFMFFNDFITTPYHCKVPYRE